MDMLDFFSPYRHGFVRVAAATPIVSLGQPHKNAASMIDTAQQADADGVAVVVFPELGVTGYSNDELFGQDTLLDAAEEAVERIVDASSTLFSLLVIGSPVRTPLGRANAAIVIHQGEILGVVPKTFLPGYDEFYEPRYFRSANDLTIESVNLCGTDVPFGTDLLFTAENMESFTLGVEICEDLWVPIPPSSRAALAGATVIANLSASPARTGVATYRRQLVTTHSAATVTGYIYAAAGHGESTTDLTWDGHAMIAEDGTVIAERAPFSPHSHTLTVADIDLDRISNDRDHLTSFGTCAATEAGYRVSPFRVIPFTFTPPASSSSLRRTVHRYPYVPTNSDDRDERCATVYGIQVEGLRTRLEATGIEKLVIGVSGGLDSTHALLVCCEAMDAIGLPRKNILAYTLPGFATSDHTKSNAVALMEALGVTAATIPIDGLANAMLQAIDHPAVANEATDHAADDAACFDVTYENVQAGARTSLLFRLANHHRGMVVGTGDLSELALGWATYGVGDQMSHYGVNVSVPKSLMQYLLRWVIDTGRFTNTSAVLTSILETEISPELIPGDADDAPAQSTQAVIGPYPLQDFTLYYLTRFGFRPSKIAYLAYHAWGDQDTGEWPIHVSTDDRVAYDLQTIASWLDVFLRRFFASQFKRTAIPNGPKVGTGGSLSPRGDWRMPSDVSSAAWRRELRDGLADCDVTLPPVGQ